ncbi:hypothetical protein TRFO_41661 [Tritrichomonas foetus]|uniref:Uncharacterized protein n=1 Tax=Tritrichomonas foetus TaxID=1144522 RepID=A0A1J4L3X6_9EUKA|nr:hypothetical protein TRFO_41661 [Tritrichomonas foetus]|eukprot:OHT16676.1 hypothetical protein TRFO_41661 [Tritrichomonas foetus]
MFKKTWQRLLKWKKKDFPIMICSMISVLCIWFYLLSSKKLYHICKYDDANYYWNWIDNLLSLKLNGFTPKKSTFFQAHDFRINDGSLKNSKRQEILPLVPLLLSIIEFLLFKNRMAASILFILVTSLSSTYLFNRFLKIYKIGNTKYSNLVYSNLLSFYPMRYLAYKSIVNSESLFLSFLFIMLISIKIESYKVLYSALFLSCLSNEHGFIVCLALLSYFCYIDSPVIRNNIIIVSIASFLVIGLVNLFIGNGFFGYFYSKYILSGHFSPFPFTPLFFSAATITTLNDFHGQYMYFLYGFIGILFLYKKSLILTFLAAVEMVYISLIWDGSIYRVGIPFEILIFIGFEEIINDHRIKKIIPIFCAIIAFISLYYAARNIKYS